MSRISPASPARDLLVTWRASARNELLLAREQLALARGKDEAARLGRPSDAASLDELLTENPLALVTGLLSLLSRGEPVPELPWGVLPPHVNSSGATYRVEVKTEAGLDAALRRPLDSGIRIPRATIRRIEENQPFSSIQDLLDRATPGSAITARLARSGALAGLHGTLPPTTTERRAKTPTEFDPLFIESEGVMAASYRGPDLVERVLARLATSVEQMTDPLAEYREMLGELDVVSLSDLEGLREGHSVRIAGHRIGRGTHSRPGEVAAVSLLVDDGTGQCEIQMHDELAQIYRDQLSGARSFLIDGVLSADEQAISLVASGAWSLTEMSSRWRAAAGSKTR